MTKDLNIGGLLRERRARLGLTLKQVACRAHTDPGNLSRIERNEQQLSVPRMLALCDALGWPAEDFVRCLTARRGRRVNDAPGGYSAEPRGDRRAAGERLRLSFTARLTPDEEPFD
ncbi:helix-turn-helix domain-containing protein [Alloalcanivorax sp. C16-1]|uniref:helix-turn-helix domain-containing protein n=1 Tax=Alloalcanivorax sp. C16-1 TaxID=3390051 RepID=UPI0039707FBA